MIFLLLMDNLTSEQRRKNMQRIRSKDTEPERIIAKELRRRKIYFTKNDSRIYGKPDFVFRRKKVVVFVDSDFWHGNPDRFVMPKSNLEYWQKKIENNKRRDVEVNQTLDNAGWTIIRIWEDDIRKDIDSCMNIILQQLDRTEF